VPLCYLAFYSLPWCAGQDLTFLVAGKPAFDVPIAHVHNTSINKTEVAIEFLQPESAAATGKKRQAGDVDELIEMRLYIPGSAAAARKREAKVKPEGQNGAKEESESDEPSDVDGDGQTAAQTFHDEVKERAEVGHVAGESLITFNEVHCTTPRYVQTHVPCDPALTPSLLRVITEVAMI
jgi:structure-specific recognition protein 1